MVPLTYVILAIITITFWAKLSKTLFHSYVTPWSVFGYIWIAVLCLYHLRLFNIDYPVLSWSTNFMLWGGLINVFFAGLLVWILRGHKYIKKKINLSIAEKYLYYAILLSSVLGLIGIGINLYTAYKYFGLEMLKAKPWITKAAFRTGELEVGRIWNYLIAFMIISANLIGIYLAEFKKSRALFIIAFVAVAVHIIVCWGRIFVALFVIILASTFYLWKWIKGEAIQITLKRLIKGLTIFLTILIVSHIILYIRSAFFQQFEYASEWEHYYIYLTGSIAAFDQYVSPEVSPLYLGKQTFHSIAHWLKRLKVFDRNPQFMSFDNVWIPVRINTFTAYRHFYEDFSFLGVFVPALIIFSSMMLMTSNKKRDKLLSIAFIPYIYYWATFTFIANLYFSETAVFGASLINIVILFLFWKKRWLKIEF